MPYVLQLEESRILFLLSEKFNIPINDERLQSMTHEQVVLYTSMIKAYTKNSDETYFDEEFEDEQNKAEMEDMKDQPLQDEENWEDI